MDRLKFQMALQERSRWPMAAIINSSSLST
jgi:hypothetical protein